jgi:branched-chain amino acid transport system permease protein
MASTTEKEIKAAVGQQTLPAEPARRGRSWLWPAVGVAFLVAAALVPQFVTRDDFLNLLFRVCLFVALAQSWNILAGFTGQTSLGHAAFFGIGAFATRTLWLGGQPLVLAMVLGGLAAVLFAVIIGVPTFRLRGAYFAIGTLGIAEVLRIFVGQRFPLLTPLTGPAIVNYNLADRYYWALGVAALATIVAIVLRYSALGLGLEAVREDEEAARATGVPVLGHKLFAFGVSSFFAGLAGGVFAYHQVSYYPSAPFGPQYTFDALLITYIGGLGTIVGPIIGSIFFIVVQEQLALTLEAGHQIIFGVLFIIVVLAFPGGLVEAWNRLRGYRRRRTARGDSPAPTTGRKESDNANPEVPDVS